MAGIKLPRKCSFGNDEVEFPGNLIRTDHPFKLLRQQKDSSSKYALSRSWNLKQQIMRYSTAKAMPMARSIIQIKTPVKMNNVIDNDESSERII